MGTGDLSKYSGQSKVCTLIWGGDNLKLIDQRKLPFRETYVKCTDAGQVEEAIKKMVVRGAPAIGVSAAYGVALSAVSYTGSNRGGFLEKIKKDMDILAAARPTAVNLTWAVNRMKKVLEKSAELDIKKIKAVLVQEAEIIEREDLELNYLIGQNGLELFKNKPGKIKLLTHCNAGALAASGYGTALAVVRVLDKAGKVGNVIVDETRPFLQGARLTAWELFQERIPFFVITDNMAGHFMSRGEVDAVIVGADRIAANGDSANKIGTMSLSIIAKYFKIPFYVAAPLSTIDPGTEDGRAIPIEERDEREVRMLRGTEIIPAYMPVRNPAFDVSPAGNISAIITEEGNIYPPFRENIEKVFKNRNLQGDSNG